MEIIMIKGKRLKTATVLLTVLVFGITAFFVACYPGDTLTVSDTDIVATFYNSGVDFGTKVTYSRPAKVYDLADSSFGTDYDFLVRSLIDTNMSHLGYTLETDSTKSHVHLIAITTQSTWVGGSCYPSYWGWGYPGWGWCYPVTYSYTTGSLMLLMVNNSFNESNPPDETSLWFGGLNGLIEGSSASISGRITNGINQAFEQSPYLRGDK